MADANCGRSAMNYPSRVAHALNYHLLDRTCSGATTANILHAPQIPPGTLGNQVPPQIDAVSPDTGLVTITIGGNDVDYMNRVVADSCATLAAGQNDGGLCRTPPSRTPEPTILDYGTVQASLLAVVGAVRVRAPGARVVLVDYLPLVSQEVGPCSKVPLNPVQAESTMRVHHEVAEATARAAQIGGTDLVRASRLGAIHTACAKDPWVAGINGKDNDAIFYHTTASGMTALAQQIVRQVG